MASTGATALSSVAPAPGSHSAALPMGGACSWEALLRCVSVAGGECCPAPQGKAWSQPCDSVLLTQSPGIQRSRRYVQGLIQGEHAAQKWKSGKNNFQERSRGKRKCLCHRVQSEEPVTQSCPTLCDSMDYTVHGILQARILEWVAFAFSRESSQLRD